jgi:Flp pilus assembly protein TadD
MRCPVCRADNDQEATCRRCKADLELLVALERQRAQALAEAGRAAARGDGGEALRHVHAAHGLRADEDSWRALAVAYVLAGRYGEALACYRQLVPSGPMAG